MLDVATEASGAAAPSASRNTELDHRIRVALLPRAPDRLRDVRRSHVFRLVQGGE